MNRTARHYESPSKRVLVHLLASNTLEELSQKYGVNVSTVWRWCRKHFIHTERPRGMNHWSCKLTDEDIVLIRTLYEEGLTQKEIAGKFEVSATAIGDIVNYKTWRHVK